MQSLDDFKLENKTVLLRLDLNVPLASRGEIRDSYKIEASLPTIKAILAKGGRVAVASHLGRPHGAVEERLSMANVGEALAERLNMDVILADDCVGDGVKGVLRQLKGGEVMLLENLRFNAGEVANSEDFAKELAEPFDYYVYDALGCAHRNHASVVNVARRVPSSCLGPACQQEMKTIRSFFADAYEDDQLGVVIGGRSFAEKVTLLQGMLDHTKLMLIGGGVASTLLAAQGLGTGLNKVDKKMINSAKAFLYNAKARGVEVILPVDHQLVNKYAAGEDLFTSKGADIEDNTFAVDIGPETLALFQSELKNVQRVLFCCPLGVSEWDHTGAGTRKLAKFLIENKKPTIFGGSELNYQLNNVAIPRHSLKCTAGNSLLSFLATGDLPALKQFSDPEKNVLVS